MKTIALINGALGGDAGNTYAFLKPLLSQLRTRARVIEIHLEADRRPIDEIEPLLLESDGFVFATGAYWDSWGSPLQAFLENATRYEGGPVWLGKPPAVVVTTLAV